MASEGTEKSSPSYPYSPARVIARAYLNGLSSLRNLLRERVTKDTKDVYTRTQNLWTGAMKKWEESKKSGDRDFSHITGVERHMRRNFYEMIWKTTAPFGNKEYKRVRSERTGQVGRMNRLINMAGAQLRNYVVTRFPFPEPEVIGQRGGKPIFGYGEDSTFGWVEVSHATLGELDFADMIRSHVLELCRKCFIYDVPMNAARRYVSLLIWRLSPFLEYLYTSGESGRWGFARSRRKEGRKKTGPDADKILREIVAEIESIYGTRTGRPKVVTESVEASRQTLNKSFFKEQIEELRRVKKDVSREEKECKEIWADLLDCYCRRGILRDEDAKRMQEETVRRARWQGIRWHRLMSNGLPQPFGLESVVLDGDSLADEGDEWLLVAEVPVTTELGEGRADLVMFKRYVIQNPRLPSQLVVWKPVAVFDIKSKTAFDWEIISKEKVSKKHGKMAIPGFILRRRSLTESEWDAAVKDTPRKDEKQQLEAYAKGLAKEYGKITGDVTPVSSLTGVIVLDTTQDSAQVRPVMWKLVKELCRNAPAQLRRRLDKHVLIVIKDETLDLLKLTAVVKSSKDQLELISEKGHPLETVSPYSPHDESTQSRNGRFVLYLAVNSASRSGISATWIARYWHGLRLVQDLKSEVSCSKVIWLDLAGDLGHGPLAETRLGLSQHLQQIRELFRTSKIRDLSSVVHDFLFRGQSLPTLEEMIGEELEGLRDQIVVVSGWSLLRSVVPPRLRSALSELERILAVELRQTGTTVVWFGEPEITELTSSLHQRRSVIPFADRSFLSGVTTDIVWNLPIRPYASGQLTPLLDDLRVIVSEDGTNASFDLVEIQPLQNWSSRFWNVTRESISYSPRKRRGRSPIRTIDVLQDAALQEQLIRDSLELVPWCRNYLEEEVVQDGSSMTTKLKTYSLKRGLGTRTSGGHRLTYRTRMPTSRHGKSYMPLRDIIPKALITHHRGYREILTPTSNKKSVHRPPNEALVRFHGFSEKRAEYIELKHISQVVKTLLQSCEKNTTDIEEDWTGFLKRLGSLVTTDQKANRSRVLNDIVNLLQTDPISVQLWDTMGWMRGTRMTEGLNPQDHEMLEDLLSARPHLTLSYGNYLFLMLLGLVREFPSLTEEHLKQLWDMLRPWQLKQMSFRHTMEEESEESVSRFDIRAVWANLRKRVKTMVARPVPESASIRYGQFLVYTKDEDESAYSMVLEERYNRERMLVGVWVGSEPLMLKSSMSWATTNRDEIVGCLLNHSSPSGTYDIAVSNHSGDDYLWICNEGEWALQGKLDLVRQKRGSVTGIRGLCVSEFTQQGISVVPRGLQAPSELGTKVQRRLTQVFDCFKLCVASCVSLDIDSEGYVVSFCDLDDGELVDKRVIQRTSELIALLRTPVVTGLPLRSSRDSEVYLTWRLYDDIDYGELQLFKPYVERKTPFVHVRMILPQTASDLMSRDVEHITLTVTHDESLCPVKNNGTDRHDACWRIGIPDDVDDSFLKELSTRGMADNEILSLISSGKVFLEGASYDFDHIFDPELHTREAVVFRESSYFARKFETKRVSAGTYLQIESEKLVCILRKENRDIVLNVRSDITGEEVYSWILVTMEEGVGIQDAMIDAEARLQQIVDDHFGEGHGLGTRIDDYEQVAENIREMLQTMYVSDLRESVFADSGMDHGALEELLQYYRDQAEEDPTLEIETASVLHEVAQLLIEQDELDEASAVIEECIEILESYLNKWDTDSVRIDLSEMLVLGVRVMMSREGENLDSDSVERNLKRAVKLSEGITTHGHPHSQAKRIVAEAKELLVQIGE